MEVPQVNDIGRDIPADPAEWRHWEWSSACHGHAAYRIRCGGGVMVGAAGVPLPVGQCRPPLVVTYSTLSDHDPARRWDARGKWAAVCRYMPDAFQPTPTHDGIGESCTWAVADALGGDWSDRRARTALGMLAVLLANRPAVLALAGMPPHASSDVWPIVELAQRQGTPCVGACGWGSRGGEPTGVIECVPLISAGRWIRPAAGFVGPDAKHTVGVYVGELTPDLLPSAAVLKGAALAAESLRQTLAVPGDVGERPIRVWRHLAAMDNRPTLRLMGVVGVDTVPAVPTCGYPHPLPSPLGRAAADRAAEWAERTRAANRREDDTADAA